ncbi:MAG: fumarylacetoacetate hydrolase family protein [Bacillota bacterium]
MVQLTPQEQELLAAIRAARQERRALPSRGDGWGVDLEGAYRVQAASRQAPVKGYKIGLTSPAKQAQMGIDQPIWGRIDATMVVDGPLSLRRFVQPRLEPELAVLLKAPVPPDASPGAAWAAVAGFVLAVDVLDSVWEGYRFTAPEVVADNASGGAFILGQRLLQPAEIRGTLRLYLNGRPVTEGPVEALADTGQQLCWLASRTGGLAAGQFVGLGSPAAAVPAEPGVLEVTWGDAYLTCRLEE